MFPASDESAYLTGDDIPVDGGLCFTYSIWQPGAHVGVGIDEFGWRIELTSHGDGQGGLFAESECDD